MVVCRSAFLAASATGRRAMIGMSKELVEVFIDSFEETPEELILDFDSTDDAVHGKQEGRFFHGYYDHYCFLPLYVFLRRPVVGGVSSAEQD